MSTITWRTLEEHTIQGNPRVCTVNERPVLERLGVDSGEFKGIATLLTLGATWHSFYWRKQLNEEDAMIKTPYLRLWIIHNVVPKRQASPLVLAPVILRNHELRLLDGIDDLCNSTERRAANGSAIISSPPANQTLSIMKHRRDMNTPRCYIAAYGKRA